MRGQRARGRMTVTHVERPVAAQPNRSENYEEGTDDGLPFSHAPGAAPLGEFFRGEDAALAHDADDAGSAADFSTHPKGCRPVAREMKDAPTLVTEVSTKTSIEKKIVRRSCFKGVI